MFLFLLNGPLSSCLKPHFQNEIKVKAIHMKMFFNSHACKTDFHKKNFALGLDLKARVFGTRNWPTNKRSHFLLRGRDRERGVSLHHKWTMFTNNIFRGSILSCA